MASLKPAPTLRTQGRPWLSLLLTLPMAFVLFVLLTGGTDVFSQPDSLFAFAAIWILDCVLFFKLLHSGKTDRYRAVLFIAYALALSLVFITHKQEVRGHRSFSSADFLQCQIPFCHIVTTMILVPAVLARSIIFPGSINEGFANISMMLVIVAGAFLILGRGFGSWGCFYGGWDDAFSRLRKRRVWKNPPTWLRWGGFAVLILVALSSAALLYPSYCVWLCPFKAVTEYSPVTDLRSGIQALLFVSLFAALVVILPILTGKRTQCAWFCPMGALCSLSAPISLHEIRIDRSRCIGCKKCVKACPIGALDAAALEAGKAHMQCVKCGRCADVCPRGCIGYRLRFTRVLRHPTVARVLFLYSAFAFLATFSGGVLQQSILIGLRLAASGQLNP